ncbi:MAG: hypothetical protein AB8G15_05765 [Saprospiraceae bacterium]
MEINTLVPSLKEKLQAGQIAITDLTQLIPRLGLLVDQFPAARSLHLKDSSIKYNKSKDQLNVTGTIRWTKNLSFDLALTLQNTTLGPKLTALASLPAAHTLSIPGLDWFSLEAVEISLSTIPLGDPYIKFSRGFQHQLSCTLRVEKIQLPLTATYQTSSNLVLQLGLTDFTFKGIGDMLKIVGGAKNISLPAQIDQLGAIRLHQFSLEMAPGPKKVSTIRRISFGFGTAKSWELIPDIFSLEAIDVVTEVYNPLKNSRSFGGIIRGDLRIGKTQLSVSAMKEEGNPWTFKATAPTLSLSDLAEKVLKVFSIEAKLPKIIFSDTTIAITPATGNFSIASAASEENNWVIALGNAKLTVNNLKVAVARTDGQTTGHIEGTADFLGTTISVKADFAQQLKIEITLTQLSLKQITSKLLPDINFPSELPDINFDQVKLNINPTTSAFSLAAVSTKDWEIPLGVAGLQIDDIHFSVSRKKAATGKKMISSGVFGGKAHIGTAESNLEYKFPGDFVFTTNLPTVDLSPVIQDLCGTQAMMGISVPDSISNLKLTDIKIKAAPKQKYFSLSGTSPIGNSELIITKNKQGKWAFITGFSPAAHWRFSSIDSTLTPLDNLNLSNSMLVLSSAATKDTPLSIIQVPDNLSISRGLTFMAALNLSELGVKDLMNIEMLTISTTIDRNPANIKLAAGIAGHFKITDSVSMGDMNFFLKPVPSNFELGISGSVLAKIGDSDLNFVGTMGIRPIERSAAFAVTMLGIWKEPFDIKGLQIGNVALEVGIGIVPPPAVAAPIVGIAGTMAIGSVTGSAAVKFDTANPNKSMIAASFNRLFLREVIETFCDKKVLTKIPKEIKNTVLAVGLEDVGVYVVPQPTSIGELAYEQGFRFEGKLSIADFNAQFYFLLSYQEGFAIKASMDPIRIGKVFALEGSGNYPGPTLDIDLRLGKKAGVVIAGHAKLLGLQAETLVTISDQGFLFFVEGKIFDVFVASLTVSGGNLKKGGDFYIKAVMRNDLISYLREEARKGIKAAAAEATKEIEKAQNEVRKAQREVDKIQSSIETMRKTIKGEREKSAKGVRDAENAVKSAQRKVDSIQKEINKVRKTIQKERDRDTKRLRAAQKEVTKAQNAVNSIQGEINKSKRRIDQLNADIRRKKKWYNNSGWKKSYRWAEYSGYVSAKGIEIGAVYTKIGGMEGAKATAYGVLEGAKQVVKGIELAAKTVPIDMDPRIVGLYSGKGIATGALETAKHTLKLLQATIKAFPIDMDVRIVALFTAKGTATGALQLAIGSMEIAKAAVGGLAEVGDFIVKHGLGGLFDVKKAAFEGRLNGLSNGGVTMSLELILLKKPLHLSLAFNFKNIGRSVELLTKKLLEELK